MMTSLPSSVLIADDEPGIRLALAANFARQGWRCETAAGVREALTKLQGTQFDLVVCDVRMGDGDGFEVMQAVQVAAGHTAFLFLTAYGSVPEAVRAVQDGAVDYLTKPTSFEHLLAVAQRVMEQRAESGKASGAESHEGEPAELEISGGMIGRSRALATTLARARAAANTGADILIEAESGTGKELLARLIHEASPRRDKPFIAINCAALPEALLESELFGHARGAFTGAAQAKPGKFELANGGTLLLDEIGDMPLSLQPKLLRVLQERTVERLGESRLIRTDIRVIASTNVHLASVVDRGLFRSDLFFRLNVIPLTLPPLRERSEDLPLLAEHFARSFARANGKPLARLSPQFLRCLTRYNWPGNVRELGNFMQRVLSLSPGPEITADCFDREHRPVRQMSAAISLVEKQASHTAHGAEASVAAKPMRMDQVERTHLERTLDLVGGNRTRAAEMLGISVRTMRNKIRQYDLPPPEVCLMPNMPVLSQLEHYLALTNKRETMITANMANIDTPGYRTQDIDFGRELALAMGTGSEDSGKLNVHAHAVGGLLERADGNNVDMDRESMLLSQTQLQYGLGTQLLKERFHQLLAAINGDK